MCISSPIQPIPKQSSPLVTESLAFPYKPPTKPRFFVIVAKAGEGEDEKHVESIAEQTKYAHDGSCTSW